MRQHGIGQSIRRSEDLRLVRGHGCFTDDLLLPGACHMVVVRSPFAHAVVTHIDPTTAQASPGVVAVLSAADAEADGIGRIETAVARQQRDGSPMERPPYRVLAFERVRFVGDAVAIVVAETRTQAQDAAELVAVEYAELPAVTDALDAVTKGAPAVWPELVPDNVSFVFSQGERNQVDEAIARAAKIVKLDFRISRVAANPLEPRNAIGQYDSATGRYTLHAGLQNPHRVRTEIAQHILQIPASKLRVISPDTGGAFGMKGSPFPEHALVLWAARRTGRTVRWQADRSESLVSDYHARDNISTAELALAEDGTFLALRVRTLANLGAYLAFNTPHSSTNNLGGLAGVYRTPAIHVEVTGVFTHSQPTAPYRGAGRPEATFAIERLIDVAASELAMDPVELRRRNLIPPAAMPYQTGLVFCYDSGEFEKNMDRALALANRAGFEQRRRDSRERGRLRGLGIANAIEIAGGPQAAPNEEACEIRFDPGGDVSIFLGTHNHGQGHETTFRQIAHEQLGIAPERIEVLYGDTDMVLHGRGTFGSRSISAGGTAFAAAARKIVSKGERIAAHLLEAEVGDIEFAQGVFRIAGTDRQLEIAEVARVSFTPGNLPAGMEYGLIEKAVVAADAATFPNGCHVCEVEIDPETGVIDLTNYVVVDDVGRVINPLLLKGQIHGGIAQGIGQALMEQIVFDSNNGQIVTGSFLDYSMPRADDLPYFGIESNEVLTRSNPLGVKGAGEAGTVGALVALVNATVDALSPLGIRHLDMPLTSNRVWAAIRSVA